jgi:hypothetical protein
MNRYTLKRKFAALATGLSLFASATSGCGPMEETEALSTAEQKVVDPATVYAVVAELYSLYSGMQEKKNTVTRADLAKIVEQIHIAKREIIDKLLELRLKDKLIGFDAHLARFRDYDELKKNHAGLYSSLISPGHDVQSALLQIARDENNQAAAAVSLALNLVTMTQAVALLEFNDGDPASARAMIAPVLEVNRRLLALPSFPAGWPGGPATGCNVVTDLFRPLDVSGRPTVGPIYHAVRKGAAGYHGGSSGEFRFYDIHGRLSFSCFDRPWSIQHNKSIAPTVQVLLNLNLEIARNSELYNSVSHVNNMLSRMMR